MDDKSLAHRGGDEHGAHAVAAAAAAATEAGAAAASLPRGLRPLAPLIGLATAALLVAMVLLTTVDVVGRYFLGRPLQGAFELTELAMGAMIFASLPLVALRRQHVTVDLLAHALPARWQRLQMALVDLCVAVCTATVAWQLARKAAHLGQAHETTATLAIPVHPLVWLMAVLAALALLVSLLLARADWQRGNGGPQHPDGQAPGASSPHDAAGAHGAHETTGADAPRSDR